MTGIPTSPPASAKPPLSGAARYTLVVLTLVYTLGFLDRQIINILAEPIKQDLHLADWQLGILTGFAFAIFYTALGIPIARIADRWNRPWLIAASLATWSLFSTFSGLAHGFAQLALARFGVGVGEAGGAPPAFSLISDVVPVERRASAVGLYSLGIPIGTLLGLMIGGVVTDHYGWRAAFLIVGLPGLALALLVATTLPEPRRRQAKGSEEVLPLRAAFAQIRSKPAFWWICGGTTLLTFIAAAPTPFLASYYLRSHPDEIAVLSRQIAAATGITLGAHGLIGTMLGIAVGIGGCIGTWTGGAWTDRWARTDRRAYVFVPLMAGLTAAPFLLLALVVSPLASFAMLLLRSFAAALAYGPAMGSTQTLVYPRARATASAVMILFWNLIGFGLGPVVVGAASDWFDHIGWGPADGLRLGIAASQLGLIPLLVCFWRAGRTFREDWVG